ncbi:MAG: hypothetical protein ABI400_00945 [Lacisediminihabitans sp.]
MKDSRIAELRRIAFGRDSTAEARAAASAELRELEKPEAAHPQSAQVESDAAQGPASEPHVAEHTGSVAADIPLSTDSNTPSAQADTTDTRSRAAVRAIWLVPIVLVSLAIGAVGGSLWSAEHPSAPTPITHPSFALGTNGSGQPGGDLAAAERILARPRSADDTFPLPNLVQNLTKSTVRFLGGDTIGVQVWAGRNTEAELCLLVYESKSTSGAALCTTPADFTNQAMTLGFNQYQVSWNGPDVSVFKPYGS